MTHALTTLLYFAYGGLYAIMDLTLSPRMLRKFKTQEGANEPIDGDKYKRKSEELTERLRVTNRIVKARGRHT